MDALQARVAGLRDKAVAREAGDKARGAALLEAARAADHGFALWLEGFRGMGRLTYIKCGGDEYGRRSPLGVQASHSGDIHVGITRKRRASS